MPTGDFLMIITYLRSSFVSTYKWCPLKAYIDYTLGYSGPGILPAHRGTIYHRIMEILGHIKLSRQKQEETHYDDICGTIDVNNFDLDEIETKVYEYYSSRLVDLKGRQWTHKDLPEIKKWIKTTLEYNDGMINPLNKDIFALEKNFNIELTDEWARYSYDLADGSKLNGFLKLIGTIDNIAKVNDTTLEILDYKSGQSRKDWSKNEDREKDYSDFEQDFQLRLYHYALSKLYPEIENIITSIYYVRAGGLFSLCFSKDDVEKTHLMIRDVFLEMKNNEHPKAVPSWKCLAFCNCGLQTYAETDVKPIKEYRDGSHTKAGCDMSVCKQTEFALEKRGMPLVTQHYGKANSHSTYKNPGSV